MAFIAKIKGFNGRQSKSFTEAQSVLKLRREGQKIKSKIFILKRKKRGVIDPYALKTKPVKNGKHGDNVRDLRE